MYVLAGGGFLGVLIAFAVIGIIIFLIPVFLYGGAILLGLIVRFLMWVFGASVKNIIEDQTPRAKKSWAQKKLQPFLEKKALEIKKLSRKIEFFIKNKSAEIKELSRERNTLETETLKNRQTFQMIMESHSQNLITKDKFDVERAKIETEFNILNHKIREILNRIDAIEHLSDEFQNLSKLKDKGILTAEELHYKREELIQGYTK